MSRHGWIQSVMWATASATVMSACGDEGGVGESLVALNQASVLEADALVAVQGDRQVGPAGQTLRDSLVVRALSAEGEAVADVPISFLVMGGGSMSPEVTRTDAQGYARSAWTLGNGSNQVAKAKVDAPRSRTRHMSSYAVVFNAEIGENGGEPTENPVPVLATVSPDSAAAGSAGMTIVLRGTGFIEGSVVRWDGADRTTLRIGDSELHAEITSSDLAAPDTIAVAVFNPAPGGGVSNTLPFRVTASNPVPRVASLSPTGAAAGSEAITLTVFGSQFVEGALVRWNGETRATSRVSSTELRAAIPSSDLAQPDTAVVTVSNPAPGGGISNGATFVVRSAPLPADDVVLSVDWSTELGSSPNAIGDGGRFDEFYCTQAQWDRVLRVVGGDVAGWSLTPNVLQVTNAGAENCAMVENRTDIPQGQDFYVRMYIRVEDENQPSFHSFKTSVFDPQMVFWSIQHPNAEVDYRPVLRLMNYNGPEWNMWWPAEPLEQGRWYRFEYHVEIFDVANRRYRLWPRVYDLSGALLYDASSYVNSDIPRTLAESYANGSYGTLDSLDRGRWLALGYEGNAQATDQGRRWFYAGLEVRTEGWPGPIE